MFTGIKRRALHIFHSAIARLWVGPLEDRIIPKLEKKSGWLSENLIRWARWGANAGRVIVNEMHLKQIRWAGSDWSVTYLGTGESAEILCYHLFPSPPHETEQARVFLWQVPALVRRRTAEGDLVVCELNQIIHLSPQGTDLAIHLPALIRQVIVGFDRPLDAIVTDFHPDIRKRIRRLEEKGYSFVITQSQADFDLFYHRMYLPYIKGRHTGRSATVSDYDYVVRFFNEGVLVLVKKNEEPVAGGVCQLIGDTSRGMQMGVLDGEFELVRDGANVALWWFALNWGHRPGARRFDLGSGFPITANGVINFKWQWGSHIERDLYNHSQWSIFGKNLSIVLRDHLNRLGFITEASNKHFQVMLSDSAGSLDKRKIADQLYRVSKKGLAGIAVISQSGEMQLFQVEAV